MARLTLHDSEVSEVVGELHDAWPGMRLVEPESLAPVETDVLGRWEAEDHADLLDLLMAIDFSLAWNERMAMDAAK